MRERDYGKLKTILDELSAVSLDAFLKCIIKSKSHKTILCEDLLYKRSKGQ